MGNTFIAKVELFEREKGWYYVSVPMELSKPFEYLADRGLIAVIAEVGNSSCRHHYYRGVMEHISLPCPRKCAQKKTYRLVRLLRFHLQ